MEDVADPHKPNVKPRIEIAIAIQSFLEDEESRNLSKHTFEEEQVLFRNATKGLGRQAEVRFPGRAERRANQVSGDIG